MMEFILWVIFTKNSVKSCNNKKNCDYFIDDYYWWLLIIVDDYLVIIIIMVVIKKVPNKLILVVVYIGLLGQFETFSFYDKISQVQKSFFSKCDQTLNGKFHFLCSELVNSDFLFIVRDLAVTIQPITFLSNISVVSSRIWFALWLPI